MNAIRCSSLRAKNTLSCGKPSGCSILMFSNRLLESNRMRLCNKLEIAISLAAMADENVLLLLLLLQKGMFSPSAVLFQVAIGVFWIFVP